MVNSNAVLWSFLKKKWQNILCTTYDVLRRYQLTADVVVLIKNTSCELVACVVATRRSYKKLKVLQRQYHNNTIKQRLILGLDDLFTCQTHLTLLAIALLLSSIKL